MPQTFRELLTPASRLSYLAWRAMGSPWEAQFRTLSGLELRLRKGETRDYGTAYSVFVEEEYPIPAGLRPEACGLVIDLGANVGYATLYLAQRFPNARLIAFEPHPAHCRQIRLQAELNGLSSRVTLVEAGAGASARKAFVTDRLVCSTVNQNQGDFSIEMVDFFEYAGKGVIDVLKMDIEGGERELLEDPRFGGLQIRYLAMEWHEDAGSGRDWCRDRLSGMGYRVGIRRDRGPHGTLTATREASIELPAPMEP